MPEAPPAQKDPLRVVVDRGSSTSVWTAAGAALVGTLLGGLAVWMGVNAQEGGLRGQLDAVASDANLDDRPSRVDPPRPGLSPAQVKASDLPTPSTFQGGLADAVERTRPSVVCLLWGPPGNKDYVAGAGVIYDARGIVLTNYHVIEPMLRSTQGAGHLRGGRLMARFADGREREARVLMASSDEDLAVLSLQGPEASGVDSNYATASFGQSADLRVGDTVFAVGCPVGLDHTVSAGIVSALDRTGVLPNPHVATIQLDAAINLGNSGGPLFDNRGELVGITSARSSRGEGIGFAIPADRVRVYLQALEAGQADRSGVIGAVISAGPATAERLSGVDYATGLTVAEVDEDGPASRAGLRADDIIVEVRGRQHAGGDDTRRARANFLREFMDVARHLLPRETLALTVVRDGKRVPIEIVVEAASDDEQARIDVERVFGLRLNEGQDRGQQNVVHGIVPGSRLLRTPKAKGVLIDHRITQVGSSEVRNLADLGRVAAQWKDLAKNARGRRVYMRLESPKGETVELAYPLDWRE